MKIKISGMNKENHEIVIKEFPNGRYELIGDSMFWVFEEFKAIRRKK